MEKRIEIVKMKAIDIKTGFGNPRKISAKNKEELKDSLDRFGDFGCFIIDEDNNVIAGNQRLSVIMQENPEQVVLCKKLYGYSKAERKAINIKANTHSGEWDLDMLAGWTADLNIDLGLEEETKKAVQDRSIPEMELIHYEKYDYVLIACRNEIDFNYLVRTLGIEGKKVKVSKRKINGRAIWFDKMKGHLLSNDEYEDYQEYLSEKEKK